MLVLLILFCCYFPALDRPEAGCHASSLRRCCGMPLGSFCPGPRRPGIVAIAHALLSKIVKKD